MSVYNSVSVEQVEDFPLMRMNCESTVTPQDLEAAYVDFMAAVKESEDTMYFMLDLSNHPELPLRELVSAALAGSYTDPKVAKWLLIGQSETSRSIANSLFFVTGEHKVVWFEDEAAAFNYLQNLGWTIQQ